MLARHGYLWRNAHLPQRAGAYTENMQTDARDRAVKNRRQVCDVPCQSRRDAAGGVDAAQMSSGAVCSGNCAALKLARLSAAARNA